MAAEAYESPYSFIDSYPWGTVERYAVVEAYKYVQRIMMIVGLICTIPLFAFSLFMRDPELIDKVTHEDFTEDGLAVPTDDVGIISRLQAFFKNSRHDKKAAL